MTTYIAQKDSMGCGVACVANRLGISYDNALLLFEYPEYARTIGYKCKYIVGALQKAGLDVRLHHVKAIDRNALASRIILLPDGAIVLLEKSPSYPYQHYLLKSQDCWVDPWINMHDDSDVHHARTGMRKLLPGRPYYAIY